MSVRRISLQIQDRHSTFKKREPHVKCVSAASYTQVPFACYRESVCMRVYVSE
jgi:hypothetical protein